MAANVAQRPDGEHNTHQVVLRPHTLLLSPARGFKAFRKKNKKTPSLGAKTDTSWAISGDTPPAGPELCASTLGVTVDADLRLNQCRVSRPAHSLSRPASAAKH